MVFEKVREIVAYQGGLLEKEVTLDTVFGSAGLDSLDFVEVLMSCEDEFNLEIPDEAAENIETVGALVDYIKANM